MRGSTASSIVATLALLPVAAGSHASEILVPEDYGTIQAALDVAAPGDTVSVAPGVYPENVRFKRNGVTLSSHTRHAATIQGDGSSHVVVLNLASGTVDGFVITGSGASDAGVFTSQAQQVIRHNLITGNYHGITISGNSVAWIEANHIEGNDPDYLRSGIRVVTGASGTIVNNFIAGSGVGIWVSSSAGGIELINNSFVDNTNFGMAFGLGGGISSIRNNIVTGSDYGIYAMGEFALDRSGYVGQFLVIDYNLFWGNSVFDYYAELGGPTPDGSAEGEVNWGPFQPLPGTSEVHADPLLDPMTGYQLLTGSAAIDAGDNAICPQTDLDGHLRPYDGNDPPDGFADCDIGAVEYVPEPGRWLLLGVGIAAVLGLSRMRRR